MMGEDDQQCGSCCCFLTRYATGFVMLVVYCIGMGTTYWVHVSVGAATRWGLFEVCLTHNATAGLARDSQNDLEDCGRLWPGEMENYFELAQVLSCVCLVGCIFIFATTFLSLKEDCPSWTVVYPLSCFVTVGLMACYLAVFGVFYSGDIRWKNRQPSLGYSYWITVGAAGCLAFHLFILLLASCLGIGHGKELSVHPNGPDHDKKVSIQIQGDVKQRSADQIWRNDASLGKRPDKQNHSLSAFKYTLPVVLLESVQTPAEKETRMFRNRRLSKRKVRRSSTSSSSSVTSSSSSSSSSALSSSSSSTSSSSASSSSSSSSSSATAFGSRSRPRVRPSLTAWPPLPPAPIKPPFMIPASRMHPNELAYPPIYMAHPPVPCRSYPLGLGDPAPSPGMGPTWATRPQPRPPSPPPRPIARRTSGLEGVAHNGGITSPLTQRPLPAQWQSQQSIVVCSYDLPLVHEDLPPPPPSYEVVVGSSDDDFRLESQAPLPVVHAADVDGARANDSSERRVRWASNDQQQFSKDITTPVFSVKK